MQIVEDLMDYDYICHHGVKGQKWGVLRYTKPDGSLNKAGKKRYQGTNYNNIKNKRLFGKDANATSLQLDKYPALIKRSRRVKKYERQLMNALNNTDTETYLYYLDPGRELTEKAVKQIEQEWHN